MQADSFGTKAKAVVARLKLPQFTTKHDIKATFHCFDMRVSAKYNFILGQDFQQEVGVNINNKDKCFEWDGIGVLMVLCRHWSLELIQEYKTVRATMQSEEFCDVAEIQQAKYEKPDLAEVAASQEHLTSSKRSELLVVLNNNQSTFQGTVGCWRGKKIKLILKEGVTPYHGHPYKIPHAYQDLVKAEVNHLMSISVLSLVQES